MSEPYGQQPPGSFNEGQGGPAHGGMPPAPQEYGSGAVARPGTTTAAAVLAFVQAGITLVCTVLVMIGLGAVSAANDDDTIGGVDIGGALAFGWIVSIAGLVGGGLLIWGAVKALSGTAGNLLVIAAAVQIVLCLAWLIGLGGGVVAILLAVMPIIILVLALGAPAKQFEASRRR
jgi:hypothetical protein